ncbi:TerD family protein [Streptomyces sp. NPDC047976]|uniref:TerD family protein n=1 Tax=Streptomyces sp. NPDC047976 TaxID=3155746 RepID=UPI003418E6F8
MTQIIKGGNLPLSGEPVRVAVVCRSGGPGTSEVDAAALLVDAGGKVRGQEDLVFHNQPEHAGSGVRLVGKVEGDDGAVGDWLEFTPRRVEQAVERIVIAASCHGGTFGEVAELYLRAVSAATGAQLALYEIEDATTEEAILLGEFYRRDGGWKFRAVGQGYASGLPGLASDFGLSAPSGLPAPASPAGPVPAPGPVSVPVMKTDGPAPNTASHPAPPAAARHVPVPASVPAPCLAPVPVPAAQADGPAPGATPSPVPTAASPLTPAFVPLGPPLSVLLERRNDLTERYGPEFPYFEYAGQGTEDVEPDLTLTDGYVVVDVMREGGGLIEVTSGAMHTRHWRNVLSSRIPDLHGMGVVYQDQDEPLRLRVHASGRWMIRLRPVTTLRPFDGPVEGFGPEVLAHTGPETDVRYRFQGDENKEGSFEVRLHRRGGHTDSVCSQEGRGRGSGSMSQGPRLLAVRAAGGWSLDPRPPGSNFWSRR